jgi:predicted dehydrogenase
VSTAAGPVRVALLGVGRWGRRILGAIASISELRVTRVLSRNPETRALVPDGCQVQESCATICAADDVDGVIVASPPALHAPMVRCALEAGKAVFVEKPFTLTVADAEELVGLSRRLNAVLHVDHIDLRNSAWAAAQRELERLGPAQSLQARFGSAGPPNADIAPRWDWAPHPIALACDLFGRPTRIAARQLELVVSDAGVVEVIELELAFSHGRTAHIVTGNGLVDKERRCTLRTRDASLVYDDHAPQKLLRRDASHVRALSVDPERPLTRALRRFASAVRTATEARADAQARAGVPDQADGDLAVIVVATLAAVDRQLGVVAPRAPLPTEMR